MTREKLLSVLDIAEELNTGKATTKFMLKRFKKWLPCDLIDGQAFYHPDKTIKLLFIIQENLDMGMLPSKIEKKLDVLRNGNSDDFSNPSKNEDIRLNNGGLNIIESLITDIGEQQKRIAKAHEKRAEVEERKAFAIEKRAEAEEKKADAMNNIAAALQEMNRLRTGDPAARQIAHQAASIIVADETIQEDTPIELDDLSSLIQDQDNFDKTDAGPSSLLEEDAILEEFDNLSLLLDETEESDDKPDDKPDDKIDDLSELIDEDPLASAESVQLDDLSLLLDPAAAADDIPKDREQTDQPLALDDLSALIDQTDNEPAIEPSIELDDLSQLIDDSSDSGQKARDLDDLSLLITDDSLQMDDLSKLIDDPKTYKEPSSGKDEIEDTPAIKIDISPEKDLGKYKAAIMKIIIELKSDGLSVEEATDRLNKNKIKTLSGKPEWGQKAISQIYKFIESAK
ncbi:MAG: recombinase family protein [Desulfobacula sp.]|uniref:recombinase family protein n=1 Tax=Desulfobacula sp. TaxID=2593537 RepID=UPI0025BFBD2B|nr:recombinase family protein [Desulfobacula sp.]MCD4722787.1 recombinase family protein [Desulfobacula sp.]